MPCQLSMTLHVREVALEHRESASTVIRNNGSQGKVGPYEYKLLAPLPYNFFNLAEST